jgi:Helix-turn-helix
MSLIVCRLIVDSRSPAACGDLSAPCSKPTAPAPEDGLVAGGIRVRGWVAPTYISDLERGARNPTITVVEKLAKALGVKPGALLD